MDNEKLTKSVVIRETAKWSHTLRLHHSIYCTEPIFISPTGKKYYAGGTDYKYTTDKGYKCYPSTPSFSMLYEEIKELIPIKTLVDYIINEEFTKAIENLTGLIKTSEDLLDFASDRGNEPDYNTENEDDLQGFFDMHNYAEVMRSIPDELLFLFDSFGMVEEKEKLKIELERESIELLKKYGINEVADFEQTDENEAPTDGLSPKVLQVLRKAIKAGFVQKQAKGTYQWNKTKELLSYFGYCFYTNDLEKHHWKLMEKMFGKEKTKNLAQTFSRNHFKNYIAQTDEEKEIDKLFII